VILLLQKVKGIMKAVTIPVMAKCRIGHFAEAQILQSLGVDFIDESEGSEGVVRGEEGRRGQLLNQQGLYLTW
jgi:hypothetical protein